MYRLIWLTFFALSALSRLACAQTAVAPGMVATLNSTSQVIKMRALNAKSALLLEWHDLGDARTELRFNAPNVEFIGAAVRATPSLPAFYMHYSGAQDAAQRRQSTHSLVINNPSLGGRYYLYVEAVTSEFTQPSELADVFVLEVQGQSAAQPMRRAGICDDLPSSGPSLGQIDSCLQRLSTELKIPRAVLRAMLSHESGWSTTVLSGDCGIGLMQITPFPTPVSSGCTRAIVLATSVQSLDKAQGEILPGVQGDNDFTTTFSPDIRPDRNLLFDDWRYNLEFGARFLLALKSRSATGAPQFYAGLDAGLGENWFYPASWFNSGAGATSGPAFGLHSKPRGNANTPANFPYFERLLNVSARRISLGAGIANIIGASINISLPGPAQVQNVIQLPIPEFAFANFCAGDRIRFRGNGLGSAELLNLATRGSAECPSTASLNLGAAAVPVTRLPYGAIEADLLFANGFEGAP